MTFTTGGPPAPGITWQALIFKSFTMSVDPELVMRENPQAAFNLAVTPSLEMRPPSKFRIRLAPMIAMGGGSDTNAALDLAVSPRLGFGNVPSTAMRLRVTPVISMNGHDKERGAFALVATPSLGMAAVRSVIFDAVGAGSNGTGNTRSWSETIGSSASAALVLGSVLVQGGSLTAITAKVGTTSMTQLTGSPFTFLNSGGNIFYLFAFGLTSPPTGAQTIQVQFTGGTSWFAAANSLSYNDVSSFGTPVTNSASGTAASISASSSVGQRVAAVMSTSGSTTGSFSSFSQTSRWNQAGVASTNRPTIIGDAPGASTVNFTSTAPITGTWGALTVPLVP